MTASAKPIHSRDDYVLMALCISLLLSLGVIFVKGRQWTPLFGANRANHWIDELTSSVAGPR